MADGTPGIISALWRFLTFYNWRKSRRIFEAADRQFTGSAQGVGDAFDIHRDQMVKTYQELRDAVAELEVVLEERRIELEKLNKEEEDLLAKRDGALARYEQAQTSGDTENMSRHKEAFERFQKRIKEIEGRQVSVTANVQDHEGRMQGFERQLTALQAEIQNLPAQKAEAIADFVSSKKIVELNDRLQGLQRSVDRGPIDAVLAHNRELTARARVSARLAGTDVQRQDEEYAAAGKDASLDEDFNQLLAARKAERAAKTGDKKETPTDERPEI